MPHKPKKKRKVITIFTMGLTTQPNVSLYIGHDFFGKYHSVEEAKRVVAGYPKQHVIAHIYYEAGGVKRKITTHTGIGKYMRAYVQGLKGLKWRPPNKIQRDGLIKWKKK